MEIERRERGALEKYHNMEGVQLKKLTPSITRSHTLPLSLLHLSISCSKLKVTLKNSWKTQKCHFWKCVRQSLTVSGYYMAWCVLPRGAIRKDWVKECFIFNIFVWRLHLNYYFFFLKYNKFWFIIQAFCFTWYSFVFGLFFCYI